MGRRRRRSMWALLLVIACTIPFLASAETLRQRIPVGMFNGYAAQDGNLASPEPDLREIWQGVPSNWRGGAYPYEAVNLVQHEWPNDISSDPDAVIGWWTDYLRQVYEAANEDGTPRLRALVGELYPQYAANGDAWLRRVLVGISRWEQEGPWRGVLAGWYVAEGPFGASHDYDIDRYERMIDVIDAVEREEGLPKRDKYVDLQVEGGRSYTPEKFVRFARPAQVILLSVNTYLWTQTGRAEVAAPRWLNLHRELFLARQMIYSDRDRLGLPRPKFHVVLELFNENGGPHPTYWEMRQQIRTALSANTRDLPSRSAPADGLWFWWWPAVQYGNATDSDDWYHGRRLAEAIEVEVAQSTGAGGEIRLAEPFQTRFLFTPDAPFNPLDSPIRYELGATGIVRVEVRTPDGQPVADFDLGTQSAGPVAPYGGPEWRPADRVPDGEYRFRLIVDGQPRAEVTQSVRTRPTLTSPTHAIGVPSSNASVTVEWTPPPLQAGVSGFSGIWTDASASLPPRQANIDGRDRALVSEPLSDGAHYFHLRAVDRAGNWTNTAHLGPFTIDTTPPPAPANLTSPSHQAGSWSDVPQIALAWDPVEDASPPVRYAVRFDDEPRHDPDATDTVIDETRFLSDTLPEGRAYYAHVRAIDAAGNLSDTRDIGPFRIDLSPPPPVGEVRSTTHVPREWNAQPVIELIARPPTDSGSGTQRLLYRFTRSREASPTPEGDAVPVNGSGVVSIRSVPLGTGRYFAHLVAEDGAGRLSDVRHIGPFWIDTSPPSEPAGLTVTVSGAAVAPDAWIAPGRVSLTWQAAQDKGSGLAGYEVRALTESGEAVATRSVVQPEASFDLTASGRLRVRIVAKDAVGNESSALEVPLRVDGTSPAVEVSSPTHAVDAWSPAREVVWRWTVSDSESGPAGVLWEWDRQPDSIPQATRDAPPTGEITVQATTDGVWFFHVRAKDRVGNLSPTRHVPVRIDATAPTPPLIAADGILLDGWTAGDGELRWQAEAPSGIAAYAYRWDHVPNAAIPAVSRGLVTSTDTRGLPDGSWWLHVRAMSATGLWSAPAHQLVRLDRSAPSIEVANPAGVWIDAPITRYSGTVADAVSGVDPDTFAFRFDNGAWQPFRPRVEPDGLWIAEGDIPPLSDGSTTLIVRVRDRAGNLGVSEPVRLMVDADAPRLSLRIPTHSSADRPVASREFRAEWSAEETTSGVAAFAWVLARPGGAPVRSAEGLDPTTRSLDGNVPADGDWEFRIEAIDRAGNRSSATRRFRVDTTPPRLDVELRLPRWNGETVIMSRATEVAPEVGSGAIQIAVTASEPLREPPIVRLRPEDREPMDLPLQGDPPRWTARLVIDGRAETRLGDGRVALDVSGADLAGNDAVGHGGTQGIHIQRWALAHHPREQAIFDETGDAVLFASGTLDEDLLIEMTRETLPDHAIALRIGATGRDGRSRSGLIFAAPMTVAIRSGDAEARVAFLWDGVRLNPVPFRAIGSYVRVSLPVTGTVIVRARAETAPALTWAAPNPFTPGDGSNPGDRTIFYVKGRARVERILIYDLRGRRVRTLGADERAWDGRDDVGRFAPGGVYLYQIESVGRLLSGSVTLIR